jgi:hypothetical protein
MIMMQTCHTPKPHHPSQVKLLMLEFELEFAVALALLLEMLLTLLVFGDVLQPTSLSILLIPENANTSFVLLHACA